MLNGQNVLCIFQEGNIDSFVGAWTTHRQFPNAQFNGQLVTVEPDDLTNRDVFIVGVTIPLPYLLEMATFCNTLTIFGFESSYGQDIEQLNNQVAPNVRLVYEPERCLATMVWRYFNGPAPSPVMLKYIEDRVQWRYRHVETRALMTVLATRPWVFDVWDEMLCSPNLQQLVEEGRVLLRGLSQEVDYAIVHSQRRADIAGYNVPVVNISPKLSSAAGVQLAKGEPFAACYWDTHSGREYALISGPNGLDISQLVRHFGGHGSRFEARFSVSRSHPLALI